MTREKRRGGQRRPTVAERNSWTTVVYDDTTGIARDIDALLDFVQQAQGGSRARASFELVRQLSRGMLAVPPTARPS